MESWLTCIDGGGVCICCSSPCGAAFQACLLTAACRAEYQLSAEVLLDEDEGLLVLVVGTIFIFTTFATVNASEEG